MHHHLSIAVAVLEVIGGLLLSGATVGVSVVGTMRFGRDKFWGHANSARQGNFRVAVALGLFALGIVIIAHAISAA